MGSTAAAGQASDAQVFILGKQGFPRPLLGAETGSPNLDGSNFAGYLTEPISAMTPDIDGSLATVEQVLARRAGLLPGRIVGVKDSLRYFTSPGGLNERVTARLVELQVDSSHDSNNAAQLHDGDCQLQSVLGLGAGAAAAGDAAVAGGAGREGCWMRG